MGIVKGSCPLGGREVVELYFRENCSRVLDLAAFLDRLERAQDGDGLGDGRVRALKEALQVLASGAPDKVRRVQTALSEPAWLAPELSAGWGATPDESDG